MTFSVTDDVADDRFALANSQPEGNMSVNDTPIAELKRVTQEIFEGGKWPRGNSSEIPNSSTRRIA